MKNGDDDGTYIAHIKQYEYIKITVVISSENNMNIEKLLLS